MITTFTPEVQLVLKALGFTETVHPADWEDIGGPENGPELSGHNEYTEWTKGDTSVFVQDGLVEAVETIPPDF